MWHLEVLYRLEPFCAAQKQRDWSDFHFVVLRSSIIDPVVILCHLEEAQGCFAPMSRYNVFVSFFTCYFVPFSAVSFSTPFSINIPIKQSGVLLSLIFLWFLGWCSKDERILPIICRINLHGIHYYLVFKKIIRLDGNNPSATFKRLRL